MQAYGPVAHLQEHGLGQCQAAAQQVKERTHQGLRRSAIRLGSSFEKQARLMECCERRWVHRQIPASRRNRADDHLQEVSRTSAEIFELLTAELKLKDQVIQTRDMSW